MTHKLKMQRLKDSVSPHLSETAYSHLILVLCTIRGILNFMTLPWYENDSEKKWIKASYDMSLRVIGKFP